MKNSKMTLTINKEDMEQNDYLYCWSEIGNRPNKTLFHSFYDPLQFLQFLEGFGYQRCGEFSEVMPIGDVPIINQKNLYKIEDGFYISFTLFDKLGEEKMVGDVSIIWNESHLKKVEEWTLALQDFIEFSEDEEGEIRPERTNIISVGQNGYELNHLNLPKIELEDIEFFYNDETINRVEKLIKLIRKGESGLTILWGERGSGKTTLSNYIISETENIVIYIPLNMLDLTISSPDFFKFLKLRKNDILVIDDAEIQFSDYFSKNSFFTGNLLQLVDGLGSKNLNLNIILILNNKNLNEVDSNLLKCNNLLDVIKVENLSDEKSKEHVTFSNSSNKRMNGKRTNEAIKRRLSKNGNEFGYK
jgi:hypothetical protein